MAAKISQMFVIFGIITFKRPEALRRCIISIQQDTINEDACLEVIVANNAADEIPVLEEMSGLPLHVIEVGGGTNIARARQALLNEARLRGADWLVFIDDDEIVVPGWFSALSTHANSGQWVGVTGPVMPIGDDVPRRMRPLLERTRHRTGTLVASAGAGNLLLKLNRIKDISFDETWPLRGGEDTDFTMRMTSSGKEISWCDEALVLEPVDPRRARFRWVWERFFLNGRVLFVVHRRCRRTPLSDIMKRIVLAAALTPLTLLALPAGHAARLGFDHGVRNLGYMWEAINTVLLARRN